MMTATSLRKRLTLNELSRCRDRICPDEGLDESLEWNLKVFTKLEPCSIKKRSRTLQRYCTHYQSSADLLYYRIDIQWSFTRQVL